MFVTCLFQNPKGFAIDLLDFLSSQWETVCTGSPSAVDPNTLSEIVMALESMANVIINNPGKNYILFCLYFFLLISSNLSTIFSRS